MLYISTACIGLTKQVELVALLWGFLLRPTKFGLFPNLKLGRNSDWILFERDVREGVTITRGIKQE